ncbi:hypothetical protein [Flavobacterium sp.]|uniref:hypothetical protein n=1 Tax=Flavobacterium sp. TaxID=239 RepID=UPI00286A6F10|nr:hypothetical protein [Flavobacterium sp.]
MLILAVEVLELGIIMGNKNINSGTVNTNGGDINIGDNKYITNVFEGLTQLLIEYREQLKKIEELINAFKPKTALDLLNDLENRVTEKEIQEKDRILSKILFLKAMCKRELSGIPKEESAKDYISAYKLNLDEKKFKERACVEYLNLEDYAKSMILADELLNIDEYNYSAWFAKSIISDDIKLFLKSIPKNVFEDYNFQLSIIQHIISTENLSLLEDLQTFNLKLNIDFEKYKEVTFLNLEGWRLAIDLSINKVFNHYPTRYISGDHFILDDNPLVKTVFNLIELYITKLDNTEIKDSTNHQKFFYNYFGYLLTNNTNFFLNLKVEHNLTIKPQWFYTFYFCQILNHKKQYKNSLNLIIEYENLDGILHSEFYLFKSALYHLNNKSNKIENIFDDYLKSINVIEERNGFNIINAFLNILYKKVDEQILINQLEKIRKKEFKNQEIRELLEITIKVRYLKSFDEIEIYSSLCRLKKFNKFDINWKNLIAENLNSIGKRNDAIDFLETYIDKSFISESLRLFILLIHDQLCDKNDTEKGRYQEILELLKFWRLNNKYNDEILLQYEHNLYTEINDLEKLEEIDAHLFNLFPENKQYILTYLNILERKKNNSRIIKVINTIPIDIDDERFGVNISSILLRNKIEVQKGFEILYSLALNPNNTLARKNYFTNYFMFKEFFKKYDEVILDSWVSYSVADKVQKVRIEKNVVLTKEFLGKKVGDNFTTISKMMGKILTIEILDIYNDAINLYRNIIEEANNPLNELGFESFQAPSNSEDFGKFFKELLGNKGTQEKDRRNKLLDDYTNYRIGFSEISRSIYKNYIDAYLNLSGFIGNRITTLPSSLTQKIEKIKDDSTNFGLDFSSLMLFYFLDKEQNFKFIHKFTISYLLKVEIEKEIIELNNSPFSSMSIQITNESITKYLTPENYREKRQSFLESILEWININCEIDLVKEKLDILPKFDDKEKLDEFMKLMIDYMYLSGRNKFHLISSDSSLFLFKNRSIANNIVNPEKYLVTFYPEKCDTSFYRFLLKSNYLGININFETLKNEFFDLLVGKENCYNLCLENLQFSINNNPNIIPIVSRFLKEIYLILSLTIEQKNRYSFYLIINVINGMPKELLLKFSNKIIEDFKLMGYFNDEIQKVFISAITPPSNI